MDIFANLAIVRTSLSALTQYFKWNFVLIWVLFKARPQMIVYISRVLKNLKKYSRMVTNPSQSRIIWNFALKIVRIDTWYAGRLLRWTNNQLIYIQRYVVNNCYRFGVIINCLVYQQITFPSRVPSFPYIPPTCSV